MCGGEGRGGLIISANFMENFTSVHCGSLITRIALVSCHLEINSRRWRDLFFPPFCSFSLFLSIAVCLSCFYAAKFESLSSIVKVYILLFKFWVTHFCSWIHFNHFNGIIILNVPQALQDYKNPPQCSSQVCWCCMKSMFNVHLKVMKRIQIPEQKASGKSLNLPRFFVCCIFMLLVYKR